MRGGGKIRLKYVLSACLLLMILFTLQLNFDTVSAATTSQTTYLGSELNQNSSLTNLKTSTSTQNSSITTANRSVASYTAVKSTAVRISLTDIDTAARTVRTQILLNHKLPDYVTISNRKVTMPQFLDLLTTGLLKMKYGLTTPVVLRTVDYPNPGIETVKEGTLSSTQYFNMAKSVKTFIDTNHRVPSYARSVLGRFGFGNLIFTNSKIFNFKISEKRFPNSVLIKPWKSILQGRPVYITSDCITDGSDMDIARINNIVNALKSMGLYAVNWGLGPNTHYSILNDVSIPKNALIVNIYGGVCAGTIWEMTLPYFKNKVGTKNVFSIWINTQLNIDNITYNNKTTNFLRRSPDDDFTPIYNQTNGFPDKYDVDEDGEYEIGLPGREDGILNPAQLLIDHGYRYAYIQCGNIETIVNAINKQAMTWN